MKIEHFHIQRFGTLEDFESGADTDTLKPLVVVEGPNEAGKSTLFHFFETVLYGFEPASKKSNPYFPWGSDEASGSARLRLDNGDSFTTVRRLRSKAEGHVMGPDGTTELLGNRPLKWIDEKHLPLKVFRKVFQITLRDLAALDPDGAGAKDQYKKDREMWETFQGRMSEWIGAMELEPPRGVASDLEKEADKIWRTTKQGNQELRDLDKRGKTLRDDKREAEGKETERHEVGAELKTSRDHCQNLEQTSLDLSRKVDALKELIGLYKRIETKEKDVSNFDEKAKRLSDSEDGIKDLVALDSGRSTIREQISEHEKEKSQHNSTLEKEARKVFDQSWKEASTSHDKLLLLDIDQLRKQLAGRPSTVEILLGKSSSGIIAIIATVLFLVSLPLGYDAVGFALLVVVALGILLSRWRIAKHTDGTTSLLKGIPVKETLLSSPGEKTLYQPLTLLKELVTKQKEWEYKGKGLKKSRGDLDSDYEEKRAALIDELGQPFESTSELDGALKQANILRHDADKAQGELRTLNTEANQLKQDLSSDLTDLPAADARSEAWPALLTKSEELLRENSTTLKTTRSKVESLVVEDSKFDQLKTASAIQAELDTVDEEKRRLERKRDRKWVIAQLIREADRLFREEHGPALEKKASAYLKDLTGGRYNTLETADHTGDKGADKLPLFQLRGPALPTTSRVLESPISTATLEQAYLSLRLATVDHMDEKRERLPLFIDEAFVNWDPGRGKRGLEVLSELSSSRQIFVFTCHPPVAELLKDLGAQVLKLGS